MSDSVITVANLSKRYVIGHESRHDNLRDTLHHAARKLWRRVRWGTGFQTEEFWALRDVSFEVKQGEVLGIIGRNGAGKSTLLKILSRITEPTTGQVRVRGRVASLLEVGTGFHPELTGRDNIFLNGAILGMKRAEILRKFDEIVAFAEVEKFLDTPVKHYSSGMYVRLAFAVAAHLDPEILIIDEVLAVGDAQFQKKCLGKMGDVSMQGRTVIFVSHDMANVTRLCQHGVLLNAGGVEMQGEMIPVISRYMRGTLTIDGKADLRQRGDRSGNGDACCESIELLKEGKRCTTFAFGDPLTIRLVFKVGRNLGNANVVLVIATNDGVPVHSLENVNEQFAWPAEPGEYCFDVALPALQLYPGYYTVDVWLGDSLNARVDYIKGAVSFQAVQTPTSGPARPLYRANGLVFASSKWNFRKVAS
jgi:lipopolysaccharide transport system ATP-binding protein